MNLINLYLEVEEIQDFTRKFVKIALAHYYDSRRKSKHLNQNKMYQMPEETSVPKAPTLKRKQKGVVQNPQKKFQAQKRGQIIEILKEIINLGDRDLNEYLLKLILKTNMELMLKV